jgi:voltage-gated potassium channel Kch
MVELERVEKARRTVRTIVVLAGVVAAAVVYVLWGSPSLAVTAFLGVASALPPLSHLVCSHVRLEPGRLVIVRDYGLFRRFEHVPRSLIDGAEVVTVRVRVQSTTEERRVVRLHLEGLGYMPLQVGDPEALARELTSGS